MPQNSKDALKLPRSTDDEITKRASAVGTALRGAIDVPLSMMREISSIWGHVTSLAHHGNIQTMSDLQVGVKILETAIYGGYCNVMINLKESSNVSFTDAIGKEADAILKESREKSSEILSIIQKRLDGNNN
jgi:glutamate formiminotransferase/formiminotetrahydrofolate cyclodeaminase